MRIANSRVCSCHTALRSWRQATIFMVVWFVPLLQGCAANAPSCDGRFEPINLPAPVSTGAAEDGATSESDSDHE